jgi:hypothetical protein
MTRAENTASGVAYGARTRTLTTLCSRSTVAPPSDGSAYSAAAAACARRPGARRFAAARMSHGGWVV